MRKKKLKLIDLTDILEGIVDIPDIEEDIDKYRPSNIYGWPTSERMLNCEWEDYPYWN